MITGHVGGLGAAGARELADPVDGVVVVGGEQEAVSRAQAQQLDLHLGPLAAAVLVSDAVKVAEPACTSKGVGLEADIGPSVSAIEADSERIRLSTKSSRTARPTVVGQAAGSWPRAVQ